MLEKVLLGGWNLIRGKMIWILLECAVIAVPAAYGASQVKTDTPVETNLRKGSKAYNAIMTLKDNFSDQQLAILVKGKDVSDILSDQNMAAMKSIAERVSTHPED